MAAFAFVAAVSAVVVAVLTASKDFPISVLKFAASEIVFLSVVSFAVASAIVLFRLSFAVFMFTSNLPIS